MATDKQFGVKVVVSAVDNITAKFKEINKNIAKSPLTKLNNSFRRLGDEVGFKQLGKAFSNVGDAAGNVVSEVGSLAGRLAALGGIGGGGLFALGMGFAQFADEVADGAKLLGVTTNEYQRLTGAAKLAGVEQETFVTSIGRFSKNVGEAAAGNQELQKIFGALGVSLKDKVTGRVRSFSEILPEAVAGLNRIQNASVRNAAGAKIFGKQFGELVPLISRFDEFRDRAGRFIVSDKDIEQGDAFLEKWNEIKLAFMSVTKVAGAALLPGLSSVLNELNALLNDNKAQIKEFFKAIGSALPGVFSALRDSLRGVIEFFSMTDAATGQTTLNVFRLKLAFGAVAAVVAGPVLLAFVSLASSSLTLVTTFAQVALKLGMLATGTTTAAGAFKALWAAMLGPVGWVIAGVTALVGLGVLLYKKWEPFRKLVDRIWEIIKGIAGVVGEAFGGVFSPTSEQTAILSKQTPLPPMVARALAPATPALPATPAGGFPQVMQQFSTQRQEASVKVEFMGVPRGTSIKSEADPGMAFDLTRGYAMGGL